MGVPYQSRTKLQGGCLEFYRVLWGPLGWGMGGGTAWCSTREHSAGARLSLIKAPAKVVARVGDVVPTVPTAVTSS